MGTLVFARPRLLMAASLVSLTLAAWAALKGMDACLLQEAVGVDDADKKGVAGILRVAKAIQTPALVAAAAAMPLIIIGAGAMLYVGSPRALRLLAGVAIGAAVLASVGGLAA